MGWDLALVAAAVLGAVAYVALRATRRLRSRAHAGACADVEGGCADCPGCPARRGCPSCGE